MPGLDESSKLASVQVGEDLKKNPTSHYSMSVTRPARRYSESTAIKFLSRIRGTTCEIRAIHAAKGRVAAIW